MKNFNLKKKKGKEEEKVVYKRRFLEEIMELIDPEFAMILLAVFVIGFSAINFIYEVPPIEVDIADIDRGGRFVSQIFEPIEEPKVEEIIPEKRIIIDKVLDGVAENAESRPSLGDEGRIGKKDSKIANTIGSGRKAIDEKVAVSSGIMGVLSSGAAAFDKVFGGGGLGAGLEKTLGSVTGIRGDQFGSGGLSVKGWGTGGGGNSLRIGSLITRGRGGDKSSGWRVASSSIGPKRRSAISAGGGQAVVMGALERSVIDSYIRRNLAKVRWCYEKELAKIPTLFGRIAIEFTIAKSGAVSKSRVKRTTMGNPSVEKCVARAIKKIRFPKPKGGGIVIVSYPFVFKNSEV